MATAGLNDLGSSTWLCSHFVSTHARTSRWKYDVYTVLIGVKREPFDILATIVITQLVVMLLRSLALTDLLNE